MTTYTDLNQQALRVGERLAFVRDARVLRGLRAKARYLDGMSGALFQMEQGGTDRALDVLAVLPAGPGRRGFERMLDRALA